ncbi:hypothetical protein HJG54_04860 [Leptolyngbya sp. NK1-12]|uniref:DUF1269 domain-containing protein n=1 Tax=Leptolyngbya sp. NK1-12 TaxID=2547451 RepID=A0AA96WSZ2_9CYAN|nr:hypothetical protein [Leptolyngbya sp. NK1-12]WNZ22257.1 hypothetical protein HJG54_04860 [Leptolyngbya sp. NK1-12]
MNYVIAVLANRIEAEAAYSQLEQEGMPMSQVSIIGDGYKTADEFGFIDPKKPARKQAKLMAMWLVPFGFIGGWLFNVSTQYQLVPAVGTLGNHVIGGLLGAVAGAMGSFFVGGGVGLSVGSGDALPYRNFLKEGKYIVVVGGAPNVTNKATRILRQLNPLNLQGYIDPTAI